MEISKLQEIMPYTLLVVSFGLFFVFHLWRYYYNRKTVRENSKYFQNILKLNSETKYFQNIGINGNVDYVQKVNSKARFDRTHPQNALNEYVSLYHEQIKKLLDAVHENRKTYVRYSSLFNAFVSEITPEECEKLHIDYKSFIKIEREIVALHRISMIQTVTLTCFVEYTSPQGRNHYSKHCTFLESEIRSAIKQQAEKNAAVHSETYRRKNERSKVTPSLRYDVMNRDGFRCCLCGRSVSNGIELEIDHIVPISKGGSTTYSNLQTLCRDCNRGKGAKM